MYVIKCHATILPRIAGTISSSFNNVPEGAQLKKLYRTAIIQEAFLNAGMLGEKDRPVIFLIMAFPQININTIYKQTECQLLDRFKTAKLQACYGINTAEESYK